MPADGLGDSYAGSSVFSLASLAAPGGYTFSNSVSTTDVDIFSFTISENSTFQATLSGLSGDADLYLLTSAGAFANPSYYLFASVNAGTVVDSINVSNGQYLTAGTYYLGVWHYYSASGASNYTLNTRVSSLAAPDSAGNSTAAARDIGTLNGSQIFNDQVSSSDLYDYYRFNITSTSNFSLSLTGFSYPPNDADVALLNSAGTVLQSAAAFGPDSLSRNNMTAGTYYVRVNNFSGTSSYTLNLNATVQAAAEFAGNSAGAARAVTLGSASQTFNDFVGSLDTQDWYTFTTSGTTNFNLSLSGMASDADVWLLDAGQNVLRYSVNGSNLSESINYAGLAAGQYYVRVYQYSGDTNYALTMSAVGAAAPDLAGNSLALARDIGTLGSLQTFNDAVSSADTNDYYRFTLAGPSQVTLNLTGMSADGDLQLQSSTGAVLYSSILASNANDSITTGVLQAGTYYARVYPYLSANTNYQLTLQAASAAPSDGGGNSTGSATFLTVGPTPTVRNDFVGDLDEYDYYTFNLGGSSNVTVSLTGLSADADVMLLNSGASYINGSANWGTLNDTFTSNGLAAGTYYVAVYQYSGNTNYTLSVTATGGAVAVPDYAGNTLALARNAGTAGETQNFSDFVSSADTNDYYRFTVDYTSTVTLSLTGMSADGDLQLLNSTGGVIASSVAAGSSNDGITRDLTAGTYYARVYPYGGASTNYNLALTGSQVAQTDIGVGLLNLGTIGATVVTRTDEVGSFDLEDVYTLTLANPGQLRVTLTGMTADADVQIRSSDGSQVLAYGVNGSNLNELVTASLGADNYQIRVYQYSGNTNYTLGVSSTSVADGAGNTTATARAVGALTNAAVTFNDFMGSGDLDYYRFTTAGAANFVLTMTGMSADADVQLLDAGLNELDYSDAAGAGNERIDYSIATAGTYYVRVYPYTGENTAYTVSMSAAPAVGGTDDSTGSATALGTLSPTNVVRTNSVGSGDTQDYFSFNLSQPGNFRLTLTGMTADADVQVLNSSGGVIAYSIAASNISEAINLNGLGAGNYYVRVYQYAGNTNYTLTVRSEASAVADGAGNTTLAARVVPTLTNTPQVFTDFVGSADTDDYYRVTIGANASLNILLDGMTTDADVYVYNSSFGLVDSSIAGGNAPDQIDITGGPTTNTYYVRVTQYSGDTNYRLTMASQALNDAAGESSLDDLDLGRIGTTARVTPGFVGTGDTSDWYGFDTGYTSNFRLILNGMTADADVRLYGADGSTLIGYSAAGGATADNISINGLAAGEYFVQVYQYAGNTNYNLSLQALAPADTAPNTAATGRVLTLGPTPITVRETVGAIDANDYYRFTLTQRSEVSLGLGNLTGNANFELYGGATGTLLLGSGTQSGTSNELLTFTDTGALNSGTYILRVLPGELGANADYTLTASATTVTPPDTAGSSALASRSIAVSTTQLNINEFVGNGVTPGDPADFYRFGLTAVSGLRVQLTGMAVDPAQVVLYGPDGTTEIGAARTSDVGGSFLEFDRLAAGTYFLGVTPESGDYAPYTLGVRTVVADDFASTNLSTGRVSVNAAAALGRIETANDVDWFRVSLTGGTRYVIRQQGVPGGGGTLPDTFIRGIYDSSGNPIDGTSNDDSEATLNSMVVFTPGITGDYFVAAGAFSTNVGTYRITATTSNLAPVVGVTLAPLDAREGQPFTFRLPWQLFRDPEGEAVTIAQNAVTLADGRPLPSWLTWDADSQTLTATSVAVNAADATLRITGADPLGATASTTLLIRTPAGTDDFASNIGTAGVVTVGGTARGNIEAARDSDWFAVSLGASTQYTIDLRGRASNNGTNVDPYLLGVYDASGNLISGTTSDNGGGSLDSRLVFTSGSAGTYYIGAGAYADNVGTYLVAVTAASTNQAPVVANPIADQRVREGVAFSFTLPANTFTDPDGNSLTYSFGGAIYGSVAAPTPTWLQFNAATRTFTGTAPANSADFAISVSARDPSGLSVFDNFTIFTDAAAPGVSPGTGTGGGTPAVQTDNWTLMIYIAADNNLESFALGDINEMELVNLPSSVNVVVLVDRAAGFSTAEGNWTDTRRGQISFHTASTIGSTLTSIGERNTGDPATLTEFINWGAQNYRANNYGLVIWDHGGGLSGTAWDDASGGANLSIAETTRAIQNSTLGRVDFLGFDTCLQGMIEQAIDVRTVADVVVASQKLEPGDGWDYTRWLTPLVANPTATDLQVGQYAVAGYDAFYSSPETLTAVNTSLLDELTTAVNNFITTTMPSLAGNGTNPDEVRIRAAAAASTQVYSSIPAYRDLGDFMDRIRDNGLVAQPIRDAATAVYDAVDAATYASTTVSGFNGLSVYLPTTAAIQSDYTSSNYRFLADTNWRGFLGAMNA